jgi:predicted ATP-dependent serine protease
MTCDHCGNIHGFVCGMCVDCGWNNNTNQFDKIEMYVNSADRDKPIMQKLIAKHSETTKDMFKRIK